MKTVGIITEYNPFHNGHKRQIEIVRDTFSKLHPDEDLAVISLMSGNFVQRGDLALLPKEYRAMAAIKGGADLVLELPYPYSSACAEVFAWAGVSIFSSLGVDYLVFGSESGDLTYLEDTVKNLSDPLFEERLGARAKEAGNKAYATIRDEVYAEMFSCLPPRKANDILGVAYLAALKKMESNLKPMVVKREGFESATASRAAAFSEKWEELDLLVPQDSADLLKNLSLVSMKKIETAILLRFRLAEASEFENVADLPDGLVQRLITLSRRCQTLEELLTQAATKVYTNARIRRSVLSCMLGVRDEQLHKEPAFSRLLGANQKGRAFLASVDFPILARAGEYRSYGKEVQKQVAFADRADSLYALANDNLPLNKPFIV